ncbi:MAG: glucose-1-phosphate adenylyltransferase [Omnitrophica bacterium RIFCSPLOWO2_01_FULL_45_10]|nr:MAG: glucose-1-phosphate adenylyltransferase [Omnitrophica bacterium RIFCSPLOWO2_01_FULL_45_10]
MKKVIALILGGGQGKRLFPLTMYRSKPAVPIGGKYRLIDIPVSNCLHSNIKDIYVLTQFNSESLNNHINHTYRFDYFSRAFVRILAAEQTLQNTNWFQGTADAVRKNLSHLNMEGDEEILILSGDQIYEMDYRDLIHYHRKNKSDVTVSVVPVTQRDAGELGILRSNESGLITGFIEKPKTAKELRDFKFSQDGAAKYLASMGVYIFNAATLVKALEASDVDLDFGREVIPHAITTFRAFGYVFKGYWKDVGSVKAFYDANIEIATSKPHFGFVYKGGVFTRPRFLPPTRISSSNMKNSIVADGTIINGARISRSSIGLRTVIGKRCHIDRTVIMGADYYEDPDSTAPIKIGIGDGCIVERAIIDKNARIGKKARIRNVGKVGNLDAENYFIRDGIVIIPKNAVLKDGMRI